MSTEGERRPDSYADIADSACPTTTQSTDSDFLVILDVLNPPERYIRPVVTNAAGNGVIDGVFAIQYRGNARPSTHDVASVASSTVALDKAEGAA